VPIDFKILNLIRVSSDFLNLFAEWFLENLESPEEKIIEGV
jgi:hypothetical protein